jgi:nicotinate-nucleotide adenylyltransferase
MIGIYGGSFNPIHLGHLETAISLKAELKLEHLFFVPCCIPVHKDELKFSSAERLQMIKIALERYPSIELDEREIKRGGKSFTIDTLNELKNIYTDSPICLIIGMDSYLSIKSWKDWKKFSQLAHLVVLKREGYNGENVLLESFQKTSDADQLKSQKNGLLFFSNTPLIEVSSSDIRSKISDNQNLDDLLPQNIIDYLQLNES